MKAGTQTVLTEINHSFPQPLQENAGTVISV
jgi:hypothetical protein